MLDLQENVFYKDMSLKSKMKPVVKYDLMTNVGRQFRQLNESSTNFEGFIKYPYLHISIYPHIHIAMDLPRNSYK